MLGDQCELAAPAPDLYGPSLTGDLAVPCPVAVPAKLLVWDTVSTKCHCRGLPVSCVLAKFLRTAVTLAHSDREEDPLSPFADGRRPLTLTLRPPDSSLALRLNAPPVVVNVRSAPTN